MTVSELIAKLQRMSPNTPVYVWDGESNDVTEVDTVESSESTNKRYHIESDAVILWGF